MSWFPLLLAVHVSLAVALLAPSLVLPFLLRRGGTDAAAGPAARALIAMQGTGSVAIAVGLAATGAGLLVILGTELLTRPWLMTALGLYAANLVVAAFISRPNLRRLLRRWSDPDDAAWKRRARQQRYVAYAMAAATGAIGFLMSTKPELW